MLLDLRLCPPAATPAAQFQCPLTRLPPVLARSEADSSKEERTGSIDAFHGRRGAGHHLFVFTSSPPSVQKEDEEGMGRTEMSLVSFLISRLRIREFPGDSERNAVSSPAWL